MRKLFSANFNRLWKNKLFWACFAAIFACSVFIVYMEAMQGAAEVLRVTGAHIKLEELFFKFVPFIGFFSALLTSMLLGTEYSDGTIRNKLVVGHTRIAVYLANLLTNMAASLIFVLAWLLSGLIGVPIFGLWSFGIPVALLHIFICVLFTLALSAIFTLISMVSSNKSVTVSLCFFAFLALIITSSMIYNKLLEPELSGGMVFINGQLQMTEAMPNPLYISGTMRNVLEFLTILLPTGQSILTANLEIVQPVRMLVLSVVVAMAASFSGVLIFCKKDLK